LTLRKVRLASADPVPHWSSISPPSIPALIVSSEVPPFNCAKLELVLAVDPIRRAPDVLLPKA
jgi:hypothetical protein